MGRFHQTLNRSRAAVQAAPEDLRASATVLGYSPDGELGVLREGSNELHCLADTPGDDEFSVACYHRDPRAVHGTWSRTDSTRVYGQRNAIKCAGRTLTRDASRCRARHACSM